MRVKTMQQALLVWIFLGALGALGCNALTGADELSIGDPQAGRLSDAETSVLALEGAELEHELAASPIREASAPFVRLGLVWDADQPRAFEVSTSIDGQSWSGWSEPLVQHLEVEQQASFLGQLDLGGPAARYYRLRGVDGAKATFLRLEPLVLDQSQSVEGGETMSEMLTYVGAAGVHTRAEWNAAGAHCSSPMGDVYRMAIHHTETPTNDSLSPEARLRQIQSYHQDVKGWCDIGYHYLMSRDGRLWQGRPPYNLGAHAGGSNSGNIGISVMGMHDSTPITDGQLTSIATLVRGVADVQGVALDRSAIKGHREYKSTSCPGDALYAQLDEIVDRAALDGGGGSGGGGGGGGGGGSGDNQCASGTPNDGPWSCGGLTGETTNATGVYYTTSFGCWVDSNGNPHSDGGDNCIPACSLASIGCSGKTGPQCERAINWYAADSDRFGCGTRIMVTNPDNGKSAVLMVVDRGPNCSIEKQVDHWVLDMSYRASYYLFGGPTSATEKADVQVVVVDDATSLGPWNGGTCVPNGPASATMKGILYAGANPNDRLADATIQIGASTTSTGQTGYWEIGGVPEGPVEVTATLSGYDTRTVAFVASAPEIWASFGLSPQAAETGTAVLQGVIYHTTNSLNRIAHADVWFSNGASTMADGNGFYKITGMPGGTITITASAPGWSTESVSRTLVDGETEWGSVQLHAQ